MRSEGLGSLSAGAIAHEFRTCGVAELGLAVGVDISLQPTEANWRDQVWLPRRHTWRHSLRKPFSLHSDGARSRNGALGP